MKIKANYIIYIIGDDACNKNKILSSIVNQQHIKQQTSQTYQSQSINIHFSHIQHSNKLLQIYQFSTYNCIRSYLDIYFQLLPQPDLIIYCVNTQSSRKQLDQWIQLIQNQQINLVFVSDVKNYVQKSQIINRLSGYFMKDIQEFVYFIQIDQQLFFERLNEVINQNYQNGKCQKNKIIINNHQIDKIAQEKFGISLKNYIRKVNTWSIIKTFYKRLKCIVSRKGQSSSIV